MCIIDYANAQSKVNAKYDSWQRELLMRYGSKLGTSMKDVYAALLKFRTDLEVLAIEGSSTAQAVSFITFVPRSQAEGEELGSGDRAVLEWAKDFGAAAIRVPFRLAVC